MEEGEFISGRYLIGQQLGHGGMGAVWLAEDRLLSRQVAVKRCQSESSHARQRFYKEAKAQAKLSHPNIVNIYDFGVDLGGPYIVMEYFRGQDLGARLGLAKRLDLSKSIEITTAVGHALDYAHEHGVIHRDVKPQNVLLSGDDSPKLADFGIAAIRDMHLTAPGQWMGTPNYMAPEQAGGAHSVDRRADVYGLAATLYHMLTGIVPANPISFGHIPLGARSAVDAVQAGLAQNLEQRPATVADFLDLLPASLSDRTGTIEAIAFMDKRKLKPQAKPDHIDFKFDLGDCRLSGKGNPRTILGYAYDPMRKCAVYIVRIPEQNTIDAKRAFKAHNEYGPLQAVDETIRESLLAKPGKHE